MAQRPGAEDGPEEDVPHRKGSAPVRLVGSPLGMTGLDLLSGPGHMRDVSGNTGLPK